MLRAAAGTETPSRGRPPLDSLVCIAGAREPEASNSSKAEVALATRIMHVDALGNARTIIEDLPEDLLETVL
jgi:hypothetical protein